MPRPWRSSKNWWPSAAKKGRQEGRRAESGALPGRLVKRPCGALPAALSERFEQLPLARLGALVEAILDLGDVEGLEEWLRRL
ncbi:MAG: DUF4351 domain-containing protein [Thiohalocapsa sp.]|nr:DUF4351 domain-containing protein [Thiohalocapsa sp.]MCG6942203.1 DUF4351 domain-containing protein [Thiohalocapsa sp.]